MGDKGGGLWGEGGGWVRGGRGEGGDVDSTLTKKRNMWVPYIPSVVEILRCEESNMSETFIHKFQNHIYVLNSGLMDLIIYARSLTYLMGTKHLDKRQPMSNPNISFIPHHFEITYVSKHH